jgi:hypothetical protein
MAVAAETFYDCPGRRATERLPFPALVNTPTRATDLSP